jgi:Tol biopolymer transport system component/DNA-binding winged helix-turn-helix (wHTH) protein
MNRIYEFGEYRLDTDSRVLQRFGMAVPLTPKCLDLLLLFLDNQGRALGRDELLGSMWPDSFVEEANLSFQISSLRKALGHDGAKYIETLPRYGYRFTCLVRAVAPASYTAACIESVASPTPEVELPAQVRFRPVRWRWYALALTLAATLTFALSSFRRARSDSTGNGEIVPLPITSYPGFQREPSLSPDGTQVAFSWDGPRGDNFDVYVKLVGQGDPLRLTENSAADGSPAWAPDGRSIAFLRYSSKVRAGIFLIPALGGRERKIADIALSDGPYEGISNLAWSPDGRYLVLGCVPPGFSFSTICAVPAESGEMRRVTAGGPRVGDFSPKVSPDGRSIAFIRFTEGAVGDVYVQSLNRDFTPRGESKRLTFLSAAVQGVAWTADGAHILYSAGRRNGLSGIQVLSFRPNWMQQVGAPTESSFGEGAVGLSTAAGGRIVYARAFRDTNIWRTRLSADGVQEPTLLISSTMLDATPDYSPDAKRIAFSSNRSGYEELWLANSDGSQTVELTDRRMPLTSNPRWSPNGREILFNSSSPIQSDLYTIEVGNGVTKRLTDTPDNEVEARWSRDGRWIFYSSDKTGRFELYKMAAERGGQRVQITRQGGLNPVESPDGRFLYYAKNADSPTSLCRVPMQGGVEEKLLDGLSYSLNFVFKEGRLYLLSLGEKPETSVLELYNVRTRTRKRLLPLDKGWSYGFALSPDQHWLSYSIVDSQGSNLMLAHYPD